MLELQLSYEDGNQICERFSLPLEIGRSALAGLRLNSWRVARRHARIHKGKGGIYIDDFGALSGTLVNGQRIACFGPLQPGHEIIIGPCRIVVQSLSDVTGVSRSPHVAATVGRGEAVTKGRWLPQFRTSHETPVPEAPVTDVSQGRTEPPSSYSATDSRLVEKASSRASAASEPSVGLSVLLAEADPGYPVAGADTAAIHTRLQHRQRLHRALLEALDLRRRDIATFSDQALREEACHLLSQIIADDTALDNDIDKKDLCQEVVDEAVGLGPLEPLLADPAITEIMVNRHDEIFVEMAGLLRRHPSAFSSEQAVQSVIERIVSPVGRRIDESSPMVDARLPDGSRVNAIIPPIALRGASLTIRKFPTRRPSLDDLLRVGALDEAMCRFLQACVADRKNIVVSGGTGSGKTTLLNCLSNCIPDAERIVTIEDAAELRLNHQHLVTLEARPANLEGRGKIEIRDLVRNSLRMRPDRIVIGECRGGEAFDMLAAMNTGHEGSLTTLHANSPRDALSRLETMILMAGMDLPLAAVREHIASSIDLIVQQVRLSNGRRLISSIVEVTGLESGRIQTQSLFQYEAGPPSFFVGCGLSPDFMDKGHHSALRQLDNQIFSQRTELDEVSHDFNDQAGGAVFQTTV